MPTYNTLADIPQSKGVDTWKAFGIKLMSAPEMGWLKSEKYPEGNWIRHDLPALRQEDGPVLSVVTVADDWVRTALGPDTPYNLHMDFGVRLYMFWDEQNGTIEDLLALYDKLKDANEVMMRVIGGPFMACWNPFWQQLNIVGGKEMSRTSVISRVNERVYITNHIRLLRHLRPIVSGGVPTPP